MYLKTQHLQQIHFLLFHPALLIFLLPVALTTCLVAFLNFQLLVQVVLMGPLVWRRRKVSPSFTDELAYSDGWMIYEELGQSTHASKTATYTNGATSGILIHTSFIIADR